MYKEIEQQYSYVVNSYVDLWSKGDKKVSSLPKFWGEAFSAGDPGDEYIGPGFRAELSSLVDDLNIDIPNKDKLISVSLGTVDEAVIHNFHILESIIEALKGTDYTLLMSGGVKTEEMIAKGLPKNIIIKKFVPQLEVLKHAKLFISHMGANSSMEALAEGVSIVGVPRIFDQFINIEVAEKLKVGKLLKSYSPEDIRGTIEDVMNDKEIQANLKKFKTLFSPKESRRRFCEIVKSMMK